MAARSLSDDPTPVLAAPWPSVAAQLAVDRTRRLNIGRRIRLWVTHCRIGSNRRQVDAAVERCPWIRPVLARHVILFRPLMRRFLDPRWDAGERFKAYAHDLEFTSTRLHARFPAFFPDKLRTLLWEDPLGTYSIELALNLANPQEGFWRLVLLDGQTEPLVSVCFSIIPGPRLFIGAVQGAARADARIRNKSATKYFHGLRPPHLLIHATRMVADAWNIATIAAISDRYQITAARYRSCRRAMDFSYDACFREAGACRTPEGHWNIPLSPQPRGVAEVPVRKRAMYRRRAGLVMELRQQIHHRIAGSAGCSARAPATPHASRTIRDPSNRAWQTACRRNRARCD